MADFIFAVCLKEKKNACKIYRDISLSNNIVFSKLYDPGNMFKLGI